MRAAIFPGDRQVEVREFPDPQPGPAEVVIRMRASGFCGSDLQSYRAPGAERGDPSRLTAGGHEPCGEVVELGAGVRHLDVGDRVMVHHYLGCGRCKWCLVGYSQMCIDPTAPKLHYGRTNHGGHAELIAVHETACVPLPPAMSFEEGAACACGTGTAFHAIKRLGLSGRDTFAIYGQGPVGLSATLFGAATGARVIAVDPLPYRRELAGRLGAHTTVDPTDTDPVEVIKELTHGEGADATLDCTGVPEARVNTVRSAGIFGCACFVGEGNTTTFDISSEIIHRQLTIYGSWTMSTVGLAEVAGYVVDHDIPLKEIFTHRWSLDQAPAAYELFDAGQTGKMAIVWP